MGKRLVYFAVALLIAVMALVAQFSFTRAGAQQNSPGHPSEECRACANGCLAAYDACRAAGTPKGQCVRELQECRQTCYGRGGACGPQSEPPAGGQRR